METISFLARNDSDALSNLAFEALLPGLEHNVDEAIIAMETLTNAHEGLSDVLGMFEGEPNLSVESMRYMRSAALNAVRPIGLTQSDIMPSLEDNSTTVVARFKAALVRLWNAIKQAASRVWQFIKQAFAKSYSRHREIIREISNARVVMTQQKSMLMVKRTLLATDAFAILRKSSGLGLEFPTSYQSMDMHLKDFATKRKMLMESYHTKLSATIKSIMRVVSGNVDLTNTSTLNEIQEATRRALQQFSMDSVLRSFPSASFGRENGTATLPLTGGYRLTINSAPPKNIDDPEFFNRAKSLTVDIGQRADSFKSVEMQAYTHSEIEQMLKVAEKLVLDISSGRMSDRAHRIEMDIEGYKKFIDQALTALSSVPDDAIDPAVREHARKVFNEQSSLVSAFTAWGGPVFLKMETLSLRTALGIVRLCQEHLKNFK